MIISINLLIVINAMKRDKVVAESIQRAVGWCETVAENSETRPMSSRLKVLNSRLGRYPTDIWEIHCADVFEWLFIQQDRVVPRKLAFVSFDKTRDESFFINFFLCSTVLHVK